MTPLTTSQTTCHTDTGRLTNNSLTKITHKPEVNHLPYNTSISTPNPSHKNRPSKKRRNSNAHNISTCLNNCYTSAQDNIVNLSNITLTIPQITALSKGMSYVSTTEQATPVGNAKNFACHTKIQYLKFLRLNLPRKWKTDQQILMQQS